MIEPSTIRERQLLAEIARLGLTIHKLHDKGTSVRVFGPGVYITASYLGAIAMQDLRHGNQSQGR